LQANLAANISMNKKNTKLGAKKSSDAINKSLLKDIYKKRDPDSRKYDFGYLLVIGGSHHYGGAAYLSARAAMRAGCDMVRVIAPQRAGDTIAGYSPNLSTVPLDGTIIEKRHVDTLIQETNVVEAVSGGKCAVLIGGGISRSPETKEAVVSYLSQVNVPTIVDAEGIHALEGNQSVIADKKILLTPHAYEFFILTGKKTDGLTLEQKAELVTGEAARLRTTIVLKGKVDILSDGKRTMLGHTGNALMTKGGLGDTLAGIAGALMARGIDPFTVGSAAAYINGAAGEIAGAKYGESMCATDLIEAIVQVLPKNKY
jgi:ADP-dependent NAD(P)H-hydrate dehydratase / NAD(P)H-hydrate epimerase